MRLLDRYLLRELSIPFVACLSGFLILWIAMDLLNQVGDFQRQRLHGADVLEFYLITAPANLVEIMPISLLLALLYSLTNLARHNELTAMRAAGISVWRLSRPYFVVGFILSLAVFALNELWVPESAERAELVYDRRIRDESKSTKNWVRQLGMLNARDGRRWFVEAYHIPSHTLMRPHIEWTLPDGSRREISAERGWREDGHWVFTNVQELIYPTGVGKLPTRYETNLASFPEFTETPEMIRSEIKVAKIGSLREARRVELSIRELMEYRRLHPGSAASHALFDTRPILETKLHGRIARPWTCLFVVLIAVPFGVMSGRRNVYLGVTGSLIVCFLYYGLQLVSLALGSGGHVPSWLAAWLPNMLVGLSGLVMLRRID